jgi:hypothetical protein
MLGVDPGDLERRIAQGTEHLSSLHEAYLKELAREARLDYETLRSPQALRVLLLQRRYAHTQEVATALGTPLALAALFCSIVAAAATLFRRRRRAARPLASFLRDSSHSAAPAHESL